MGSKRLPSKLTSASTQPHAGPLAGSPFLTAGLMAAAVGLGVWNLVARGRLAWPPTQLLASLFTIAGWIALVGPALLVARRGRGEGGLGELTWMSAGLLVWVFDLAAIARGEWRTLAWATPLGARAMGLTILAILMAGWRWRPSARDWSWTNVAGWLLGLFWVGMGLWTMAPAARLVATSRGIGP